MLVSGACARAGGACAGRRCMRVGWDLQIREIPKNAVPCDNECLTYEHCSCAGLSLQSSPCRSGPVTVRNISAICSGSSLFF